MTECQACVAFNLTDRIGSVGVARLRGETQSISEAWERFPNKVSRTGGEVDWKREYDLAERFGVRIVTIADEDYPRRLKEVPGHPLVLYVKGDVAALNRPAVALVGTRRATSYGRTIANRMAADVSAAGWSVVSGLAEGIDAEAHRGALSAGGVTVGVLGSALDRFFPEGNRALAREMVEKGGAVVSQFPFGRPPDRETFPIRNHVVAALAHGVVAVESPIKSGTLITTGIAADLGRTVMAVPSRIDSRMSSGCLQLIREGALLVRNADDVLEALNGLVPELSPVSRRCPHTSGQTCAPDDVPAYSSEEALVMLHLDEGGASLDDLVELTGLPIETINAVALKLRLKGFVRFLPGNRISLLTRS